MNGHVLISGRAEARGKQTKTARSVKQLPQAAEENNAYCPADIDGTKQKKKTARKK